MDQNHSSLTAYLPYSGKVGSWGNRTVPSVSFVQRRPARLATSCSSEAFLVVRMKSGGPWNLRGLRPQAREAARSAARRSGVSVGEWLNDVIEPDDDEEDDEPTLSLDDDELMDERPRRSRSQERRHEHDDRHDERTEHEERRSERDRLRSERG